MRHRFGRNFNMFGVLIFVLIGLETESITLKVFCIIMSVLNLYDLYTKSSNKGDK